MTTPVTDKINQEAIEDEAGLWLAKIDGRQLAQEEVRELIAWMRRSDFHREYLITLARQWDGMAALNKLATLFPLSNSEMATSKNASRNSRSGNSNTAKTKWLPLWLPALAKTGAGQAVLAFSLMLVVVVAWQSPLSFNSQQAQQSYTTAVGETERYLLADGSTLTLNTNSLVNVNYSDTQRKVTLIKGEANFDVAKDPSKPFMVYAGSSVVQAVGTAFNVRYTELKEIDVVVTEGRVSVIRQYTHSPDLPALDIREQAPTLLDAGQSVQYSEVAELIEPVPIASDALARKLAWQQGSLVFKGESLTQAVAEISRYTNKQLIITDSALGLLAVGGRYRTDDIDNLLTSLADVMDIDLHYLPGDKIQLSAKKDKK